MSLYNMMNGVSPAAFAVLPMLGKHPDEYPRFRDCFLADEEYPEYNNYIHIYTRTGGANRGDYQKQNQEMREMEGFVIDFDDSFDSTYASWVFKVPDQWQDDFNKLQEGKGKEISKDYLDQMKKVYPKLADKFDEMFA